MNTAQPGPATAPEGTTASAAPPPAPPPELTELRVEEQLRLEDAAPVETAEQPEQQPPGRRPSPHDTQMEAIVANRRARLERERAEARAQGFPDQEPLLQSAEPPAAPEVAPAPVHPQEPHPAGESPNISEGVAGAAPDQQPPQQPQVRRHRVTVRGQQFELADEEMQKAAELGIESEARMRHAEQVLAEARRIAQQAGIVPGGQSPPAVTPPQPMEPPPPTRPEGPSRDELLGAARDVLYGDEEKVADALGRLYSRAPAPAPVAAQQYDPEELAQQVYDRLDQRFTVQNTLQTFERDFPDLVVDPNKLVLVANIAQALRTHYYQTQTPRSDGEILTEAGHRTRFVIGSWTGTQPQAEQPQDPRIGHNGGPPLDVQPSPVLNLQNGNRLTMKRGMPQAPSAAAAQSGPQERPAPTNRDIVNQMRRARGQPPLPPLH